MKSDISVIVCCYNSPYQKLLNTLVSILNQENVNFDVVITDDGSKNREFQKIEDWIKERHIENVVLNCNKENRGTVRNILSAIPFCKSDYVKLISPGDYLYDEHSLKHYLDCFIHEKATIVTGKSVYYNLDKQIVPTLNPRIKQTARAKCTKRNVIAYDDPILGASLAYKKAFLSEQLNNISPKIKYVEDYPLVSICLLQGLNLSFSNEILVWYEIGGGLTTSKSINPRVYKDKDEMYAYLSEHFDDKAIRYQLRMIKATKGVSKFQRKLIYLFLFPGYFLFLAKAKLTKRPLYETDITKMDRITAWRHASEEGEKA